MKIAIDLRSTLIPFRTGVVQYTNNIIKNLLKIDQRNEYILFWTGLKEPNIDKEILNNPKIKLKKIKIPNKLLNLSFFLFDGPKIDKILNLKGENYVFFNPHFIDLPLSIKYRKVTTVHDFSFKYFPNFFSAKDKFWHLRNKIKKNLDSSKKIIAISQSTKNDIIKFYNIDPKKIKVIYHGIDHNQYKKIENKKILSKKRVSLGLPKDFILYLGPIEPRKNIDSLIIAFKELKKSQKFKNLKLVIAGFDLTNFKTNIKDILIYHNLKEEEKVIFYNLAKIFIYPSYFEGFGLPPLEAGACGIPVISSNTSSLAEILNDSALLINPYKINELIEAMRQLLTDKNLYEHLRTKILHRTQEFQWETSAKKTLQVLQNSVK